MRELLDAMRGGALLAAAGTLLSMPPSAPAQQQGPYAVGWQTVEIGRPDESTFLAALAYPAESDGTNAPVDRIDRPYPGIVFGHGYQLDPELYLDTLAYLASHGYILIAPFSGLGAAPDVPEYVADLRRCITYLEEENGRGGAPLHDAVNVHAIGLAGHSMGGAASVMAAAEDDRVKAGSIWAPARLVGVLDIAPRVTTPFQVVAGSGDSVALLFNEPYPIFSSLAGPRQIAVILNGWHWGFLDASVTAAVDRLAPIPGRRQVRLARVMSRHFFDLYLRGEDTLWSYVWGPRQMFREGVISVLRPEFEIERFVQFKPADPDGTAKFALVVRNETGQDADFELLAEPQDIVTDVVPETLSLPSGKLGWVIATVKIPPASADTGAVAVLSARSGLDGVTRDFSFLVALPPIDR